MASVRGPRGPDDRRHGGDGQPGADRAHRPRVDGEDGEGGQREDPARRDDGLTQPRHAIQREHHRGASGGRGEAEQPAVGGDERGRRGKARARAEAQRAEHQAEPCRDEADVQTGDRQDVRQPGAGIALPHRHVQIGPARDHERVHERRPRAEQPRAACRHPVAQPPAAARVRVEQAYAARDQDSPIRRAEPPPRDHPRGPAARGLPSEPTNLQGAAAGTALDVTLNDAARAGHGILEADRRGASEAVPFPHQPAPNARTSRRPLSPRRPPPQHPGHQHHAARRADGRAARQHRGANQHRQPRVQRTAHGERVEPGPQADAEGDGYVEDRRPHRRAAVNG